MRLPVEIIFEILTKLPLQKFVVIAPCLPLWVQDVEYYFVTRYRGDFDKMFIDGCKRNDYDIVKFLLDYNIVDPSIQDNQAICEAVWNNHYKLTNLLLKDDRVNPGCRNNYCIQSAAAYGYMDIMEQLLQDLRVDPSDDYNCAIMSADEYEQWGVVQRLFADIRVSTTLGPEEYIHVRKMIYLHS